MKIVVVINLTYFVTNSSDGLILTPNVQNKATNCTYLISLLNKISISVNISNYLGIVLY